MPKWLDELIVKRYGSGFFTDWALEPDGRVAATCPVHGRFVVSLQTFRYVRGCNDCRGGHPRGYPKRTKPAWRDQGSPSWHAPNKKPKRAPRLPMRRKHAAAPKRGRPRETYMVYIVDGAIDCVRIVIRSSAEPVPMGAYLKQAYPSHAEAAATVRLAFRFVVTAPGAGRDFAMVNLPYLVNIFSP